MKTRNTKTLVASLFFFLLLAAPLTVFAETSSAVTDAEIKHMQYLKKRFAEMQAESKKAKPTASAQQEPFLDNTQAVTPQHVGYRDYLASLARAWTTAALTFDTPVKGGYEGHAAQTRPWFTESGWQDYRRYLDDNSILKNMASLKSATRTSVYSSRLISESIVNGSPVWVFVLDFVQEPPQRLVKKDEKPRYIHAKVTVSLTFVPTDQGGEKFLISGFKSGGTEYSDSPDTNETIPEQEEFIQAGQKQFNEMIAAFHSDLDSFNRHENPRYISRYKPYVGAFAQEIILDAFNLSHDSINQKLQAVREDHTKEGWKTYRKYLDEQSLPLFIKSKKAQISVLPSSPPTISRIGTVFGVTGWYVNLNLTRKISMPETKTISETPMNITVLVAMMKDSAGQEHFKIARYWLKHSGIPGKFDPRPDKHANMPVEERQMMLTYLCETSQQCRHDYQDKSDQLVSVYKEKKHWVQSFFGTDRELLEEYCTTRKISFPNCGRNFVGNEYYIRLLKQLELLRSFAPSQEIISASKPPVSKIPLESLEELAKTKLVALFPHDEDLVKKLLDLSGIYELPLKYLIATRIAIIWTFSAGNPEAGQSIKKSWFTEQGWQKLNDLQVMKNIKRTMEFDPIGIETLVSRSGDGFTHISQTSAELTNTSPTWKYKVYLSHSIVNPKQSYLRGVDKGSALELTILLDVSEGQARDFLISDIQQLPH